MNSGEKSGPRQLYLKRFLQLQSSWKPSYSTLDVYFLILYSMVT